MQKLVRLPEKVFEVQAEHCVFHVTLAGRDHNVNTAATVLLLLCVRVYMCVEMYGG